MAAAFRASIGSGVAPIGRAKHDRLVADRQRPIHEPNSQTDLNVIQQYQGGVELSRLHKADIKVSVLKSGE
jgi:hypothetical protein